LPVGRAAAWYARALRSATRPRRLGIAGQPAEMRGLYLRRYVIGRALCAHECCRAATDRKQQACAGTPLSARPESPISTGMGQQEGNHEGTGPRVAGSNGAQGPQDRSLAGCLDELLDALDLHRLVFLCVGCAVGLPPEYPRKPPRIMGSGGPPLPKEITKEELAGAGNDFILKFRPRLERYAQRALYELGAGKAQYWHIDPEGAYYLEGTSDRILAACGKLSAEDGNGAHNDLVEAAMRVTSDDNQPIWTAGKRVRWEYLGEIDTLIKAVKIATVRACRTGTATGVAEESSKAKPSHGKRAIAKVKDAKTQIDRPEAAGAEGNGSNAIDTRTKRKRPTKIEMRQRNKAVAVAASGEKRESEFQEVDRKCNASEVNASARSTVNIQNSNVVFGGVHQPQSLSLGDHSSISKETPKLTVIVASWLWRHVKALLYGIWKRT